MDECKLMLGIADNLHDFYTHKVYDKSKNLCENLFDKMFDFINNQYGKYINEISKNIIVNYKNIKINTDLIIKNEIENKIKSVKNPSKINIIDLHNIIIKNFNILFNVENINNIQHNLNTLVSNEQKILLRLPLYFLIKNKENKDIVNELVDFLLKYINLDIYDDKINNEIKNKILYNLYNKTFDNKKYDNKTYPLTYFNDISTGLNIKYNRFHILNLDKNKIDESKTLSVKKYLFNYDNGITNKNMITNTDYNIGFQINDESLEFINVIYNINKITNNIICKYHNITLQVLKNNAGRENDGIYQITLKIVEIFKKCFEINPNNLTKLLKIEINNNKMLLSKIININNLEIELNKIYIKYKTLDLCLGCIVFLLFGFKRFGDWMQVELSSKLYFTLQTTDYYCKLYGLLIGAPVIIDEIIYNYEPPENLLLTNFILFNENDTKIINDRDTLIYKGLRDIETTGINRYYFNKYKKYKIKYLQLKNTK